MSAVSPSTRHALSLTAGAVLCLCSLPAAQAATYHYRAYLKGLPETAAVSSQEPPAPLALTLGQASLPVGHTGQPYSFSLSSLLTAAGAGTYSAADVSWSLVSGSTLPAGLTLESNGTVSGTPTVKSMTGTNFQVAATYQGKPSQQVYTLMVNGVVLEATRIAAGRDHTCALTPAGGVKCWGDNSNGQLGNNSITRSLTPVAVSGLASGVASVSLGVAHTCALLTSGGVRCWGNNSYGQLGTGDTVGTRVPADVLGLTSGVASVAVGDYSTCAVTSAGGAKCWGYNYEGGLGDGTLTPRSSPVNVSGLSAGVQSIAVAGSHTCAVTTDGGAKCWGYNGSGQVGDGTTTIMRLTPVAVSGLSSGVQAVVARGSQTCALTSSGVKCWGASNSLGDGTYNPRSTPVSVVGLGSGVQHLSVGGSHACAVTGGGAVVCWGGNSNGQLGDGTGDTRTSPTPVIGLSSGVSTVTAGADYSCAVTSSGAALCWGRNPSGQLGTGNTTLTTTPAEVQP